METPSLIAHESERLRALAEYGLVDGRYLPSLDPVVRIAAQMFDIPAAAVNMIGCDSVFLAANHGIGDFDPRRDVSFCAHVITQDDVMVVPDTHLDPRFHDNPLVTGPTNIRFYAGVPLKSPAGHAIGVLCIIDGKPREGLNRQQCDSLRALAEVVSDKLELQRLAVATRQGRSNFHKIAVSSPNAIVCFDQDMQITAFNQAAGDMFGYSPDDIIGESVTRLMAETERQGFCAVIRRVVLGGQATLDTTVQAITGLRRDGTLIPIEFSPSCWLENGRFHFGAILLDVTERRQQVEVLNRLAQFDELTGLPNRMAFLDSLSNHIAAQMPACVLLVDIDGFKDINDTLGFETGDELLREIGARLKARVRRCDRVARLSGDTFGVLLSGVGDLFSAMSTGQNLMAAVSEPILIDDQEIRTTAGCGLAIYPTHSNQPNELMTSADLALFEAKKTGPGAIYAFVPALRMAAQARRMYEVELHHAVERDEFELFYQPQVRLSDGAVIGAEALLRWRHPERGLLSPAAFLPALEVSRLAAPVGAWVIETACAQAAMWKKQGHSLRMGVNLFAAQFGAGDLVSCVEKALKTYGLPPYALELEITENIILDRDDLVLAPLRELQATGVGIAFDDFGTGYGSLSLLKRFPLTRIKIDQSFVCSLRDGAKDDAIVSAVISLAQGCGLDVVAEGIEHSAQRDWLIQKGCAEGQGYLFGKPLTVIDFERLLTASPLPRYQTAGD